MRKFSYIGNIQNCSCNVYNLNMYEKAHKSVGENFLPYLTPANEVWGQAVADPGGAEGAMALPSPVQISHKKDGRQRRPHRFHVSCPPPPNPAAGSDAGKVIFS